LLQLHRERQANLTWDLSQLSMKISRGTWGVEAAISNPGSTAGSNAKPLPPHPPSPVEISTRNTGSTASLMVVSVRAIPSQWLEPKGKIIWAGQGWAV
jgi:hypothetical protein